MTSSRSAPKPPLGSSSDDPDWVSASDVASYTYCPKSYELARVQHVAPTAKAIARRADGNRAHRQFAGWFRLQQRAARWALALTILAGLIALGMTWLRGRV